MKTYLYITCISVALSIVAYACVMKADNSHEPEEIESISNIISKLQRIHEVALSHQGELHSNGDKTGRKISDIIEENIHHPSEISCLATTLYDLRSIKSSIIISEEEIEGYSEYTQILEDAFWQSVLVLSTYTDRAAMYEMERLCRYLDGLGTYDAGNALMMHHAIESQQMAASRDRGEEVFWRIDPWMLENRLALFGAMKECYWRNYRQSDTIRGEPPQVENESIQGFIEINEQKEKYLIDNYSWSEIERRECWFNVPKNSTLVGKFGNAGRLFAPLTLSEIGIDDMQGKVVLNAATNVVCFDLHIKQP